MKQFDGESDEQTGRTGRDETGRDGTGWDGTGRDLQNGTGRDFQTSLFFIESSDEPLLV